jgi:hypothetical protein
MKKPTPAPSAALGVLSPPKELLGQLRYAHFALITVSIAIFISVVGSQFKTYNVALTQVLQIRDVINRWPAIRQQIYLSTVSPVAGEFARLREIAVIQLQNPAPRELQFEGTTKLQPDQLSTYAAWQFGVDMSMARRSLANFRELWDETRRGVTVSAPNIKFPEDSQRRNCEVRVRQTYSNAEGESDVPSICLMARPSADDDDEPRAQTRVSEPHPASHKDAHSVVDLILTLGPTRYDRRRDVQITIPFDVVETKIESSALPRLNKTWRDAPYALAFQELAEVSSDFEEFDIEEAVLQVRALQSASDQTVDLLGIKLPRKGAALWGLLILACTQAYFLFHLRDLAERIRRMNDVPDYESWFALHPSKAVFVFMQISCVGLPFFAAAGLAWAVGSRGEASSPATVVALAAVLVLFFLTSCVALGLWRLHRLIRANS